MDIKKTSITYQRYLAGSKSYALFFDTWSDNHAWQVNVKNVGFCSMMRTIYLWRPALAVARVLMIASTLAVPFVAWYLFSIEIMLGTVDIILCVLIIWVFKLTATALGIKTYFKPEEMPLVFQWAKASHDKVCPLVTFTDEEEEVACEE